VERDDAGGEEFIAFDRARVCEKQLTFEDSVEIRRRNCRRKHMKKERKNEKETEVMEKEELLENAGALGSKKVVGKEARQSLDVLKELFGQQGVGTEGMNLLKSVEKKMEELVANSRVQSSISRFFGKKDRRPE
jgi:hypothetical protein